MKSFMKNEMNNTQFEVGHHMKINLLLKYVHTSEMKVYNCLVQKT